MPLYDYQCRANGVRIEIHHSMKDVIKTWGELCERSGHEPGDTSPDERVEKMVGAGNPTQPAPNWDIKKDQTPFKGTAMAPMRTNKF